MPGLLVGVGLKERAKWLTYQTQEVRLDTQAEHHRWKATMPGYLLRQSITATVAAILIGIVVRIILLPSDNALSLVGLKCMFVMAHPDDESM